MVLRKGVQRKTGTCMNIILWEVISLSAYLVEA